MFLLGIISRLTKRSAVERGQEVIVCVRATSMYVDDDPPRMLCAGVLMVFARGPASAAHSEDHKEGRAGSSSFPLFFCSPRNSSESDY